MNILPAGHLPAHVRPTDSRQSAHTKRLLLCVLLGFCCALLPDFPVLAQRPVSEAQMIEMRAKMRAQRSGKPPAAQNKADEKKKEEKKKPEEDEKKKEDEIKTVKRPTERPKAVDPNRVKLKPDADGRVQFNYFGQPWVDVLQDYADAAGYSFDWQELPADYLNLTTRRKYMLKEAHDLLNRHLLARGFTLILQGELLTAVKIDKLDASLVPRVDPDDLEDCSPYDFVRVRFPLPLTMDPAKAAEDVKVLLSPNAKVTPLLATKRLLVIDAVANQRSVRDLIYAEQTAAMSDIKPRIFHIHNRRADYIADQVMIVLGIDVEKRQDPKAEQQKMQMFMQMQQKGQDVSKLLKKDEPKVHIAVNRLQNTLLVNAPADLMPMIARTIEQLDIGDGGRPEAGSGPFTMERYKTVTASTDAVITALQEIGNLSPLTQLQSDSGSKTIFAYATARDHAEIERLIGKLDGSGRRPEVIWLPPNLPADQVAGSIMALIVGEEEEEEENNFPWYWGGRRNKKKEEPTNKGFRVLPDVENNRLLLWASEDELKEVHNLISMLSRNADGTIGDNRKVRRLDSRSSKNIERLLEQLKATWPGENELEIQVQPAPEQPQDKEPADQQREPDETSVDKLTETSPQRYWLTQAVGEPAAPEPDREGSPPPIKITVNSEGQIIIASDDTAALDQLQDLIEQLSPARPEYHYFKLRHVYAYDVVYNLEKYFEDDLKEEEDDSDSYWRRYQPKAAPVPMTLGKRRPLRFIDDDFTNTVIVANASPSQLKTIKEIIQMYDQPPVKEDFLPRKTEVITVKYSRAADIAISLKDVYRDLLSSKDKAFQDKEGKQTTLGTSKRRYVFRDIEGAKRINDRPVVIEFAGVLSVGVDEVSNSLIVCARAELMDSIVETVRALDEAAKPKTVVRTYEMSGLVDADDLQKALSKALGQPWPGGKPLQKGSGAKPAEKKSQQQQNGSQTQNSSQRRGRR